MRIIVTGTVGLDKAPYLEDIQRLAAQAGNDLTVCHVGRRMYAEAPDVRPGRILDLPLSRLSSLRRSVFKDILVLAERTENILVNTHATFRWKHGLFPAIDFDQLALFNADMYICLIDNVDALHARLLHEHQVDHSLKDLLVWREEETLATELMMMGCNLCRSSSDIGPTLSKAANPARFYILARGRGAGTTRMLFRLIFRPDLTRAYLSFPMTHVMDMPGVEAEIDQFREVIQPHFIIFDPSDLEEQRLYQLAVAASQQGQKVMECRVLGKHIQFDVAEVLQVAGDIHAQIYARDFLLIDQSDMIISYIPQMPDGKPGLSSGVERELQHAHEAAKEVYVIWRPAVEPSPFITETATRVFANTDEAIAYFRQLGYLKPEPALASAKNPAPS